MVTCDGTIVFKEEMKYNDIMGLCCDASCDAGLSFKIRLQLPKSSASVSFSGDYSDVLIKRTLSLFNGKIESGLITFKQGNTSWNYKYADEKWDKCDEQTSYTLTLNEDERTTLEEALLAVREMMEDEDYEAINRILDKVKN